MTIIENPGTNGPSTAVPGNIDTPIKVVIAGELSAGKTAMINAIARANIVPRFFGHDWRPAIIVTYSETPYYDVQFCNGRTERFTTLEEVERQEHVSLCTIGCNQPHLKNLMLIEIPFYHDGEISDDTIALMESADLTIWVTIASQAWRLSEKNILDALENRNAERAILAVSRADKLRTTSDWDRINERLKTETQGYFRDTVFMCASGRLIDQSTTHDAAWAETNGQAAYHLIAEHATQIVKERMPAPTAQIIPLKNTMSGAPKARVAPSLNPVNLDPKYAPLADLVDTLNGVISAGIVTKSGDLSALCGPSKILSKTAAATLLCARGQSDNYQYAGVAAGEAESQITMRNHMLIYHKFPNDETTLFMMCETSKMNPGIAKTAFARLCRAYEAQ